MSGNVENATGRDFTGKNMIFTNVEDPNETYSAPYGSTYNIELPKGKTFTVTIEGETDVCTTTASAEIEIQQNRYDQTQDLRFVLIQNMYVSGTVSTISSHDTRTPLYDYDSSIGATLVFTKQGETAPYTEAAVEADGTYTAELISNETYDVTLKEGTGEGYTLSPLSTTYVFEAGDENPYKNILLMKDVEAEIAYDAELTVGADKEYPSISEALAAVRRMEKSRNDQTVTIVIDPGTYEEQLYVDENNIVLKAADSNNRPMIQWYYGIGYVYYSADPSGWYDADWAAQKTEQRTVSNWGATIRTYGVGFLAENLDVQNTFNKFIVQAELDDGVQPGGGDAKNYDRDSLSVEVKNKDKATERAAAIYAGGSEIELYRCSFSSSQDTFGTGATSMYVKECDISGNTDYICGGNNVYFENCNLIWTGYSDHAAGGYITASKTSNESGQDRSDLGYYFKDCTVMNSDESGMYFHSGDWGRNWGGENCQTIFDNTTIANGAGTPGKWGNMGGDPAKMSVLYVVNGVWAESDTGHTNDLTNSDDNPRGTVESNNYILPEATDFFGNWTPVHYVDESNRMNIEAAAAENGSVNFSVGGRLTTRAAEGEEVTIVPNPDPNYQLDTVSVAGQSGAQVTVTDNTFVMPNEPVTVTATFVATVAQPTTDPSTMVGDVEWYFGISNNSGKIDISGATGQIASRESASGDDGATKYLEIDATIEGARIDNKDNNDTTGYRRDEWAAITTGTKISIPVMNGSVVTVRGYGDGSADGNNLAYTINGEEKVHVSQGDQTYVYTGEAGFIDLIVTHGRYISYIKVNTPQPLEGKYADWNVGHANSDRDGRLQTVTYADKEALFVEYRNAYKVIEEPISSGVATFEFDLYIDTAIDRNFRVYLENEVGDVVNQDNVFAEVINNRGSGVNYGPGIDAQTTKLFNYSDLTTGSGWVHFTITLDYDNTDPNQFITVTATNGSGLNATQTMGAISGKDTTLRQIRLVATAQSPYFADMKLTTAE